MTKSVEIVGGPQDGKHYMIDGNELVMSEPSMNVVEWINDPNPISTGPTFKQVCYKVVRKTNGRWYALHPGIYKAINEA